MTAQDRIRSLKHQSIIDTLDRWTFEPGVQSCAIPDTMLIRCEEPSSCTSTVYEPCLVFLVQGRKTVQLGDRHILYNELSYLVTSVSLPVLGHVISASREQPFLAIKFEFKPQEITDLVLEMIQSEQLINANDGATDVNCGLAVARMESPLLDALQRLMLLLDAPNDVSVLAPLVRREILYRVLQGELGARMRKFALSDHHASRISKAIAILKVHYTEPLRVRELAEAVNMSESALFRSFKKITRMSPVQFQKRLRLYEARRLMFSEGLEAATASFRVGYESPSHFSREYSRLFGAAPKADVDRHRLEQLESLV